MKSRTTGAVVAGILWAGVSIAQAQPDPNNVPKATNPVTRNREKKQKELAAKLRKQGAEREIEQLEQALGKPLTAEQKKAVSKAAQERLEAIQKAQITYREALAKSLDMTPQQLALKQKAVRRERQRPERKTRNKDRERADNN